MFLLTVLFIGIDRVGLGNGDQGGQVGRRLGNGTTEKLAAVRWVECYRYELGSSRFE